MLLFFVKKSIIFWRFLFLLLPLREKVHEIHHLKKNKDMKKIILTLLLAVCSLGVSAQFEKGTTYVNASLSGLNMSYSKDAKFTFGLDATAGYFLQDAWMLYGRFGYDHQYVKGKDNDVNNVNIGAGARYYIRQNGLYLACGLKYEHANREKGDYLDLTPEVGYCFYLNNHVSVEPSVYYDLCLNHFSAGSKVGLRIGFGFYF